MAKTEVIEYKHVFTEEEKKGLQIALLEALTEIDEKQEEKSSVAATIGAAVKVLVAEQHEIMSKLMQGHEMRHTECRKVIDYENEIVNWVDADTGDVLREDPLQDSDRQLEAELPE